MSSAARSVYIFGIYLLIVGGLLMGSPNTLLTMLGLPATEEVWIRVLGITVMAIGLLDLSNARSEQPMFLRSTVRVRVFVFVAFLVFTMMKLAPPVLMAFGAIDLAAATWTFFALRAPAAKPAG
jgi:hypothetical protein